MSVRVVRNVSTENAIELIWARDVYVNIRGGKNRPPVDGILNTISRL